MMAPLGSQSESSAGFAGINPADHTPMAKDHELDQDETCSGTRSPVGICQSCRERIRGWQDGVVLSGGVGTCTVPSTVEAHGELGQYVFYLGFLDSLMSGFVTRGSMSS